MKALALGQQDWVHAMRGKKYMAMRLCASASASVATVIM